MKSITIHNDGSVEFCEAVSVSQGTPTKHRSYDSVLDAVIDLGLIELTEEHVEAFLEGSGYAPAPGVRTGLEAIGFKVRPDYDEATAIALGVAVSGTGLVDSPSLAGEVIARNLAARGKKIVDA